ncbi:MAG: hypothetical protein QM755_04125 [Luteolibacter sp.]
MFVLAATAAGVVLWTVAYLVLLLIAVIKGSGLGGPLAWPAGAATVVVLGLLIGGGMFLPACGIGRLVSHFTGWPKISGLPIALVTTFLLSVGFSSLVPSSRIDQSVWMTGGMSLLVLAIPLLLHWTFTEGAWCLLKWLRQRASLIRARMDRPAK